MSTDPPYKSPVAVYRGSTLVMMPWTVPLTVPWTLDGPWDGPLDGTLGINVGS